LSANVLVLLSGAVVAAGVVALFRGAHVIPAVIDIAAGVHFLRYGLRLRRTPQSELKPWGERSGTRHLANPIGRDSVAARAAARVGVRRRRDSGS
jgi:hypothetical protein